MRSFVKVAWLIDCGAPIVVSLSVTTVVYRCQVGVGN